MWVVAPALAGAVPVPPGPVSLLGEVLKGVPVALTAAAGIWAATMAGGVVDILRDPNPGPGPAAVDRDASGIGVLLTLAVATIFLQAGGAAQIARALADPALAFELPLVAATASIARGIEIAVAVAGPVACSAILLDVVAGLSSRAAVSVSLLGLWPPVRAVALLAVSALLLSRMAEALAEWTLGNLPGG